jgi:hypothetical protein
MIAATFHGPNYDASVHDESTIEVFQSLGHAMSVLFDRYDSNGLWQLPVETLDGKRDEVYFPVVTEGHYFKCYSIPGDDLTDDTVLDALTAVHTGVPDYTLSLVPPWGEDTPGTTPRGTIAISVQRGA